jgi:hypothetical protein
MPILLPATGTPPELEHFPVCIFMRDITVKANARFVT